MRKEGGAIADRVQTHGQIRLRPVREEDLPSFQQWLGDREVRLWMGGVTAAPNWEDELAWFAGLQGDANRHVWAIETLAGQLLGVMDLRWVPEHGRGSFGVFLGEKSTWNQGMGTDTVRA